MKFSKLFKSDIFSNKLTKWLFILNVATLATYIAYVVFKVRPRAFVVGTRYSTINEFVEVGKWYEHYLPMIFLVLTLVGNSVIANILLRLESVDMKRIAPKILVFNLVLTILTAVVTFYLIRSAVS